MKDRINKTSICSVVFIDIIDYSKKPVSDQIAEKECFNALLTEAIKNVAQNDRIILDTGDGAAIALMGAPEEALFVSLTIRDGILRSNKEDGMHLRVRTGINLGPVRVVTDINGMPNIIGDGINVAQRIMTFAEPNQILVSRSYYEVTSRLTEEITRMFAYSGVKQDKHVREHEVYVIKSPTDEAELAGTRATAAGPAEAEAQAAAGRFFRQRYIFPVALVLFIGVVLAGVLLPGWLFSPDQAEHAAQTNDALGTTAADTPASAPVAAATPLQAQRPPEKAQSPEKSQSAEKQQSAEKSSVQTRPAAKTKPAEKKVATASQKRDTEASAASTQKTAATQAKTQKTAAETTTSQPAKSDVATKAETSWEAFTESVKQGATSRTCTDGERALNQCH